MIGLALSLTLLAPAKVTVPLPAGPTVELLNAGKGQKRKLRFTNKAGSSQEVVMSMGMKMQMSMAGVPPTPKVVAPITNYSIKLTTVKANAKEFTATFQHTGLELIDQEGSPPGMKDAVAAALKPLQKMTGTMRLTRQGRLISGEMNIPDDLDPAARQTLDSLKRSMAQIATPFPLEAVGVGAKWSVTSKLEQSGLPIQNIITYELVKIEGDKITLKADLLQKATGKKLALPQLPPGTTADLNAFTSNGSGMIKTQLSRLAPSESTVMAKSNMAVTLSAGDKTMKMTIGMELNLKVGDK